MNAVIFYNQSMWLNDEARCFDHRLGSQALPAGSVVCGVITETQIILTPPAMTDEQKQMFNVVCQRATNDASGVYSPEQDLIDTEIALAQHTLNENADSSITDELNASIRDQRLWIASLMTIAQAAESAGVSENAVRDALKADKFPNAYRTSDHPQRGEWRIPRADVEAWTPRKYPRGE